MTENEMNIRFLFRAFPPFAHHSPPSSTHTLVSDVGFVVLLSPLKPNRTHCKGVKVRRVEREKEPNETTVRLFFAYARFLWFTSPCNPLQNVKSEGTSETHGGGMEGGKGPFSLFSYLNYFCWLTYGHPSLTNSSKRLRTVLTVSNLYRLVSLEWSEC